MPPLGGDEMRQLRERRGENQTQFADWLNDGLGRSYTKAKISRWEGGAERIPQQVQDFLADQTTEDRPRSATFLAIANQKGGVGKTATAVNLAYALTEGGARVLLIDCDSQSNATVHVGVGNAAIVDLEQQRKTLYFVLRSDEPITSVIVPTGERGLDLVPAGLSLADADVELAADSTGGLVLREKLDEVRGTYDFVVMDCAPNLGLVTANALSAAELVIVPVQTEALSLLGVKRLVDTITRIRRRVNPRLKIAGIIPTMYNERLTQDRATLQELRESYADQVPVFPPIPRATVYGKAAAAGMITLAGDPGAPGAETFREVARQIRAYATQREATHAA
ncbi:AAA family ATPase [Azospirillum isscasi]|uniref:AAA family ATPase n=1 Tax=Azospirillum isscasi TaxID=3053926 RepID=A0ABU0WKB0_9PROT|nr:AAA family ATPase [Azospirillum isscasi]MDQ2104671.1 AAA family ATPase [Azospirillum isscasi]